ncbi:MAG: OmpA family protein [Propioniciclava sp.]|uniref:OmpA family protein n=1 Tax=Propioniciclava sp. TaxID=2038686 RepID=UPI0039E63275
MTTGRVWVSHRRRAAAIVVTAVVGTVVVVPPAAASPADHSVDPASAVSFPIDSLPTAGDTLTFPEANLDGSVADFGERIVLSADVFFAYNDDQLSERAHTELAALTAKLRSRSTSLTVVGHTDSRGSDAGNLDLSLRRARAVESALTVALPDVRIEAEARGESEPVADNATEDGRSLNRRVEIKTATDQGER